MIETGIEEINVDEIMKKIRIELANRKNIEFNPEADQNRLGAECFSPLNWQQISIYLNKAEENALAGSREFMMTRFPKPIRLLARLAGRAFLYMARVITFQQSNFNQSILNAFQIVIQGIQDFGRKVNIEEAQLSELKIKYNEIQGLFNSQQKQIELQNKSIEDQRIQIELQNKNIEDRQKEVEEKQQLLNSYLQTKAASQEKRLSMFLEEAKKCLPGSLNTKQLETFSNELDHLSDPLYVYFEDKFRGTRKEILKRLEIYLPIIKKARLGNGDLPILDVGCGRGEWLELMNANGLMAKGIDLNRIMVEQCKERGIDVVEGEAIEYLSSIPDNTFGLVSAFHLIEHLSPKILIQFLDETLRVLKPAGIALFETPNPENIQVGACNFYLDLTHRNPLPPAMTRFLLESRGFNSVEIKRVNDMHEQLNIRDDDSEIARRFNEYFYGPMDYAVIGMKS